MNQERPVETVALYGGGGFIGSHLTRRLVDRYQLEVIDISDEKLTGVLDHPNLSFYNIDITNSTNDAFCREIVEKSDLVIDLIAYANPQQYIDIPLDVVELNYEQNLKLVEACADANVWLMQFSTCEVYGKVGSRIDDEAVFSEDTSDLIMGPIEEHRWIYATAKQLLERMVHAHGLKNDLEWTIIRPFNFVGPRMDYIVESPSEGTPRVFASFMSALLFDHEIQLVDGGTNRRTFTDIEDAVNAIEMIIEHLYQFRGEVVNIGTPRNETTIRGFAEMMCGVYEELSPVGDTPPINSVPAKEFYGEGYADVERRVPDVEKLRSVGWTPQYNLRETVERTVSYYISEYER